MATIVQKLHDMKIAWENVEHLAEDRPMWRSCAANEWKTRGGTMPSNKMGKTLAADC